LDDALPGVPRQPYTGGPKKAIRFLKAGIKKKRAKEK